MGSPKKIFILAGEPSGDLQAAKLLKELKFLMPDAIFSGIGGELMKKQGFDSLVDIQTMSVVGIWEVARKYNYFKKVYDLCKKKLIEENYDLFIPVDYPGFNIRLGNFARNKGIPVIYYIAPQLWAWGKKRAAKLSSAVDMLLVVFPFETEFFSSLGIKTYFIGHPMLDESCFMQKAKNYEEREKLIAFLPGSRKQELKRHFHLVNSTALKLKERFPDYRVAFARSKGLDRYYEEYMKEANVKWEVFDDTKVLLATAKVGVIKVGTSTLEASLLGLPFVMFYKTSYISYKIGKELINLPYISLPNILLKKNLVKELFQKDANSQILLNEISELLNNREYYNYVQCEFENLKSMLGESGASKRAAKIIYDFLYSK
jgi:lipid-A-disaccharide synthase